MNVVLESLHAEGKTDDTSLRHLISIPDKKFANYHGQFRRNVRLILVFDNTIKQEMIRSQSNVYGLSYLSQQYIIIVIIFPCI